MEEQKAPRLDMCNGVQNWHDFVWCDANLLLQEKLAGWGIDDDKRDNIYIYGEKNSGKSQLASSLAWSVSNVKLVEYIDATQFDFTAVATQPTQDKVVIIDAIDAIAGNKELERGFFVQLNNWANVKCPLLITANKIATKIAFSLDDVRTRLEQFLALQLFSLDNPALRKALILYAKTHGWQDCESSIDYLLISYQGQIGKLFWLVAQIISDFPINKASSKTAITRYAQSIS